MKIRKRWGYSYSTKLSRKSVATVGEVFLALSKCLSLVSIPTARRKKLEFVERIFFFSSFTIKQSFPRPLVVSGYVEPLNVISKKKLPMSRLITVKPYQTTDIYQTDIDWPI